MSNEQPPLAGSECECAGAPLCPLSKFGAGDFVCIKQFSTSPEVAHRLREMGLREEQQVRLVSCHSNFICQICNARLGLSRRLAENILVEPVPGLKPAD